MRVELRSLTDCYALDQGEGSAARFADIRFGTATIENIRNGE
jgi:hypothetical protein